MKVLKKYESFEPEEVWEDEEVYEQKIPTILEEFLDDHGCKNKFIKYIENEFYKNNGTRKINGVVCHNNEDNYVSINSFFPVIEKRFWILTAFDWSHTPEGHRYWFNINVKWGHYIE